jgi:ACS family hexuronate transporter-like MFS transporter
MLHAFARSPISLGLFRGLLGVGEAGNFPGVAKTASEWFPPKERTMATGVANIGSGTGALIATPLVAWIILRWGWKEAFVVTGAIGFVWVFLWLLFYRQPHEHPWITPEELDYIQKGKMELAVDDAPHEKGVYKLVLKQQNFWAIAIARFLSEPAWQFFSYWIPMYLVTQRGMNLKEIALFAWIPFLAADLGSFIGGALSPAFYKLGASVLTARKLSVTVAALMMPFALLIAKAPSGGWAVFWFCFGAFGHNCMTATLLTLPADLFPSRSVATANGLSGCIGYFGGMLFTLMVGWIVMGIGYGPIFVVIAFLDIFGAFFIWTLMKTPKLSQNNFSKA